MKFTLGSMTMERKLEILNELKDFKIRDNEMFLQGGTWLGAVREGGLIDHDDDIDIAYISKYHTIPEIKKEMLEIYQEIIDKNMMCKYFDTNYNIITDFTKLVDGRGQCHIYIDTMPIDLWTVWEDEEGYINFCDMPKFAKADDFLPLEYIKLYDVDFKVPKNSETHLEKIYGSDWKTPQQKKPVGYRVGIIK